jgi:hypothetical protein
MLLAVDHREADEHPDALQDCEVRSLWLMAQVRAIVKTNTIDSCDLFGWN